MVIAESSFGEYFNTYGSPKVVEAIITDVELRKFASKKLPKSMFAGAYIRRSKGDQDRGLLEGGGMWIPHCEELLQHHYEQEHNE